MRPFTPRGERIKKQEVRINDRIRAAEVRVVADDGGQLGVISISEALAVAKERGLDLVEVAPEATPPVCRIMNYGKYVYQLKKKLHDSKKKQKVFAVKEVKFRPNIDDHDYDFKKNNVLRFLEHGDKVKATVQFRGREMTHTELGIRLLQRLQEDVKEGGYVETRPEMQGMRMHVIIAPGSPKGKTETTLERKPPERKPAASVTTAANTTVNKG